MKRLLAGILLVFGSASIAFAQESSIAPTKTLEATMIDVETIPAPAAKANFPSPGDLTGAFLISDATAATSESSFSATPKFSTALAVPTDSAEASPALPAAPLPRFLYGDRDDYRWQLGLGIAWERFTSSIFNASAVGVNTSLIYYTNDWLGIEGTASTMFAPTIFANEHVKFVNYGAGPRVVWRKLRWEPFGHAILGATHTLPKTAGNSANGFALQLGGGVDYRVYPRLSFRVQGDCVRTSLFGQSQNNFQAVAGAVIHF
jgi:opacity protein-like surface antigen